jgi:hypothetical protein
MLVYILFKLLLSFKKGTDFGIPSHKNRIYDCSVIDFLAGITEFANFLLSCTSQMKYHRDEIFGGDAIQLDKFC